MECYLSSRVPGETAVRKWNKKNASITINIVSDFETNDTEKQELNNYEIQDSIKKIIKNSKL